MTRSSNLKRNVLIVAQYASLYGGNFIPSLLEFARYASERRPNSRVIFCFPEEARTRTWVNYVGKSFPVTFFDPTRRSKSKKSLRRVAKQNAIETVYCHFISSLVAKIVFPKRLIKKLVVHIHSDFSLGRKPSLVSRIKEAWGNRIRRDALLLFVSRDLFEKSRSKKKVYIPNCISFTRVPCETWDRGKTRDFFGIGHSDELVLIFAWSPETKGLDIAVTALNKARKKNPRLKLLVVCGRGDGVARNKSFVLSRTSVDPNSEWIIYANPTEDVFRFHEAADLLLSASRSEGFSYSVLEALSIGKPVIVSDIPGTKWALHYGAIPFDSGDSDSLAAALSKTVFSGLSNHEIASRIKEDFSISKWTASVYNAIWAGND